MKKLTLNRFVTFEPCVREQESPDGDHVVDIAFASELPYERWFGIEILDCDPKSVRLDRLNDDAPLLFNHEWNKLLGVHIRDSVTAEDGKVRGKVRITAATQESRDAIALVKSGVLTKASIGYIIHKIVEVSTKKDGSELRVEHDCRNFRQVMKRFAESGGQDRAAFLRDLDAARGEPVERATDSPPVFRVMDWEPYENSLVTVPADPTVGIGRAADDPDDDQDTQAQSLQKASAPAEIKTPAVRGYLPPWMAKANRK